MESTYTHIVIAEGLVQVVKITEPGEDRPFALAEPLGLPLTDACFARPDFCLN